MKALTWHSRGHWKSPGCLWQTAAACRAPCECWFHSWLIPWTWKHAAVPQASTLLNTCKSSFVSWCFWAQPITHNYIRAWTPAKTTLWCDTTGLKWIPSKDERWPKNVDNVSIVPLAGFLRLFYQYSGNRSTLLFCLNFSSSGCCHVSLLPATGGGLFLTCEEFGRMFGHSFPACTLKKKKSGDKLAHTNSTL